MKVGTVYGSLDSSLTLTITRIISNGKDVKITFSDEPDKEHTVAFRDIERNDWFPLTKLHKVLK